MDKIDEAIPYLTDLNNLYNTLPLDGQHTLLKKVFEVGLMYDGELFRTPYIHKALMHNYNKVKEKGLLEVGQPGENFNDLEGCTA